MVLLKAFLLFLVVWACVGAGLLYWTRRDGKRRRQALWGLGIALVLAVVAVVGLLAMVISALSRT